MAETRRKFDRDFKEGAVRLVRETGKPIAEVARDLGVNEGTLGNWVNADRRRRGDDQRGGSGGSCPAWPRPVRCPGRTWRARTGLRGVPVTIEPSVPLRRPVS